MHPYREAIAATCRALPVCSFTPGLRKAILIIDEIEEDKNNKEELTEVTIEEVRQWASQRLQVLGSQPLTLDNWHEQRTSGQIMILEELLQDVLS